MHFEEYQDIVDMAHREKRIKEWKRSHKIRLIEQKNSNWCDLYYEIIK
jgi:putative endonuclease